LFQSQRVVAQTYGVFFRASTANESLAAASMTTSLIELEPTSMAAIFMTKIYESVFPWPRRLRLGKLLAI